MYKTPFADKMWMVESAFTAYTLLLGKGAMPSVASLQETIANLRNGRIRTDATNIITTASVSFQHPTRRADQQLWEIANNDQAQASVAADGARICPEDTSLWEIVPKQSLITASLYSDLSAFDQTDRDWSEQSWRTGYGDVGGAGEGITAVASGGLTYDSYLYLDMGSEIQMDAVRLSTPRAFRYCYKKYYYNSCSYFNVYGLGNAQVDYWDGEKWTAAGGTMYNPNQLNRLPFVMHLPVSATARYFRIKLRASNTSHYTQYGAGIGFFRPCSKVNPGREQYHTPTWAALCPSLPYGMDNHKGAGLEASEYPVMITDNIGPVGSGKLICIDGGGYVQGAGTPKFTSERPLKMALA